MDEAPGLAIALSRLRIPRRLMESGDNVRGAKATADGPTPGSDLRLGAAVLSAAAWTEIARSLSLTPRELEMTRGVFDNLTEVAIAADLGISEHTAHVHLNHLFKKLHVTTRAQVILCVMQELLQLTISDTSVLPPICRQHANGRCPLQD